MLTTRAERETSIVSFIALIGTGSAVQWLGDRGKADGGQLRICSVREYEEAKSDAG